MKIYISGPMTGYPDLNRAAFNAKAAELRAQGHEVVNPAEMPEIPGGTWADYMRADLKVMLDCEAIYLLPGWRKSRGARVEHFVARVLFFIILGEAR